MNAHHWIMMYAYTLTYTKFDSVALLAMCYKYICFILLICSDTLPLVDMYGLEGLREIIICTLKIDKCHMFHKVRYKINVKKYSI